MTAHDHQARVAGCYRCELGRDEAIDAIVDTALEDIDGRLRFNVEAYGKPWTGEFEDTKFVAEKAIRDAVAAALSTTEAPDA